MNKELFDKLNTISDKIFDIEIRTKHINETLDQLIAALHNYDDGLEMFDHEPPNEALKEALKQYNEKVSPCVGHDAASWEQETELNKRMDVIGQNGNEGLHYDENEFDDYGQRVEKDRGIVVGYNFKDEDNNKNTQGNKRNDGEKVLGEHQVKTAHIQYIKKTKQSKVDSQKYITNHKLGLGNKLG